MKKHVLILPNLKSVYLTFSFFIFIGFQVFGGTEIKSNRVSGTSLVRLTGTLVMAYDDKFPNNMLTNAAVKNSYGKVIFGIDNSNLKYFSNTSQFFPIVAHIEISAKDVNNNNLLINFPVDLEIDYNNVSNGNNYTDKQVYTIEGAHVVSAKLLGFRTHSGAVINDLSNIPSNLFLQVEIETERYYQFNPTIPPLSGVQLGLIPHTTTLANGKTLINSVDIYWDNIPGAEEYQLEWVYINDYDGDINSPIFYPLSSLNLIYQFENNSTRITTPEQHYEINWVFEHGYILYRVRGVGKSIDVTSLYKPLYGRWSNDDVQENSINSYPSRYPIDAENTVEHDKQKNWQFNISYAEEGKKKEVSSYMDGSLRTRQSVTKSNTDNNFIIGETIYDNQGRPAIQILPAPSDQTYFKYYKDFNISAQSTSNEWREYSQSDFERNSCLSYTSPLTERNGASLYYSDSVKTNTTDLDAYQSFVPDANDFPFAQTEYTPDNTGRVRRQGAPGADYQLNKHETKYFYGQPEQVELDRLFGSEVGDFSHYKKNIVQDANSQLSVSYIDMKGKTIATALAGAIPTNLNQIDQPGPSNIRADYLKTEDSNYSNPNRYENNRSIIFSKELLVTSNNDFYAFDYTIAAPTYEVGCANLCYDCIYDLQITIKDECNNDIYNSTIVKVGYNPGLQLFDATCSPTVSAHLNFIRPLNVGNYTVLKKLTINEASLDFYTKDFEENNICLNKNEFYIAKSNLDIDTNDCHFTCDDCVTSLVGTGVDKTYAAYEIKHAADNPKLSEPEFNIALKACIEPCTPSNLCQTQFESLLLDVTPGGQYFEFKWTDDNKINASSYPLSLFNSANWLPDNMHYKLLNGSGNPIAYWRNSSLDYMNEDETTSSVIILQKYPDPSDPSNPSKFTYYPPVTSNASVVFNNTSQHYETPPWNLSDESDFRIAFKPSWAKALVKYHPEYMYYEWCKQNNDYAFSKANINFGGITREITSDGYDSLLRSIDTYGIALSLGLINVTDPDDLLKNDPYFSTSLNPNKGRGRVDINCFTTFSNKILNYYSITGGSSVSLKQYIANIIGCGNIYYPNSEVPCNGSNFSPCSSVFGSLPEVKRNEEWLMYRDLYLSEKQKFQQQDADNFAKDVNYYTNLNSICDPYKHPGRGRYNGCIGLGNRGFNPYAHGLIKTSSYNWSFSYFFPNTTITSCGYAPLWSSNHLESQYYNGFEMGYGYYDPEQPSYSLTNRFYANKVKRFRNSNDIADIGIESNADPLAVIKKLENFSNYNLYVETGQCPSALQLQYFLNYMVENSKMFKTTGVTDVPLLFVNPFTKKLYDAVSEGSCALKYDCPFINYTWFSNNNPLLFEFKDNDHPFDQPSATIDFTGSLPQNFDWSPVKKLANIKFISFSGGLYYFRIKAYKLNLDGHLEPFDIIGKTCINLNDCGFSKACKPSEVALDLQILFNQLTSTNKINFNSSACSFTGSDFTSTTPIVLFSNLLRNPNLAEVYDEDVIERIGSYIDPPNTLTTWTRIAETGNLLTGIISKGAVNCSFDFNAPATIHWEDILYFSNINPDLLNSNSFYIDAFFLTGTLCNTYNHVTLHVTTSSCFNFGSCDLIPAKCNNNENDLRSDLQGFLDKLAESPTLYFNVTTPSINIENFSQISPLMTAEIGQIFSWSVTGIDTNTNGFDSTLHAKICTKPFAIPCPPPCNAPGTPPTSENCCEVSIRFLFPIDLQHFNNIIGISNLQAVESDNTNSYLYDFTATAELSNGNHVQIIGSSCLPIGNCHICTPSIFEYPFYTPIESNPFFTDLLPTIPLGTYPIPNYYTLSQISTGNTFNFGEGHGPGNSEFLVANLTFPAEKKVIWQHAVENIKVATDYTFSFWIAHASASTPFIIIPRINNIELSQISANVLNNSWINYTFNWNSGSTSGPINFALLYTGSQKCFLALDDIVISSQGTPCVEIIEVPNPAIPYVDPCVEMLTNIATLNGQVAYQQYLEDTLRKFRDAFIEKCLKPVEDFYSLYDLNEYHYTLYYYDQAGNLIRTIPPEGVRILNNNNKSNNKPGTLDSVIVDRATKMRRVYTTHILGSDYEYNSLNQLTRQSNPDYDKVNLSNLAQVTTPINFNPTSTFFNGCNGFMTGYNTSTNNGAIYGSNDCGATWSPMPSIGLVNLKKTQMISDLLGYAVGDNGSIVKTTDGGTTWINLISGTTANFNDLYFVDASIGMAVGDAGTVYYTFNGGTSWALKNSGLSPSENVTSITKLNNVYFITTNHNTVSFLNEYYGSVYSCLNPSTNSGWTNIKTPVSPAGKIYNEGTFNNIQMVSQNVGYACGNNGTLLKTQDGGSSWYILPFKYNFNGVVPNIISIHFDPSGRGFIVFETGEIFKVNLSVSPSEWLMIPGVSGIKGLFFYTDNDGYAYGIGGKVYKLNIINQTYSLENTIGFIPITSILITAFFINNGDGYIVDDLGNVFPKINNAWKQKIIIPAELDIFPPITGIVADNSDIDKVSLISAGDIYDCSNFTGNITVDLAEGTSSGAIGSGSVKSIISIGDNYYAIKPAIGNKYRVWKKNNSQNIGWSELTSSIPGIVSAICAVSGSTNRVFVAGRNATNGIIHKISDPNGNSSWVDQSGEIVTLSLNHICKEGSSNALDAVGANGCLMRSIDGNIWIIKKALTKKKLNSIFINQNIGFAVGEENNIWKFSNSTWSSLVPSTPTSTEFNDVVVNNNGVGYICSLQNDVLSVTNPSSIVPLTPRPAANGLFGISSTLTTNKIITVGNGGGIFTRASNTNSWLTPTEIDPPKLNAVSMFSTPPSEGFAVGDGGKIYHTINSGGFWNQISSTTSNNLNDVDVVNGTSPVGFIAGDNGVLLESSLGNNPWVQVAGVSTTQHLKHIYIDRNNNNNLYVVGNGGTIIYRKYPAVSCTKTTKGTKNLNSVFAIGNVAFAVGDSGVILKSIDYGSSWASLTSSGTNWVLALRSQTYPLYDVYFRDKLTGYAVGGHGTVLKTTDGGTTWFIPAKIQAFVNASTNPAQDIRHINFTSQYNGVIAGNGLITLNDESNLFSVQSWYDELGRLIVSQNPKQFNKSPKAYSYTRYDDLGRIEEVGEFSSITDIRSIIHNNVISRIDYNSWLGTSSNSLYKDITKTIYTDTTLTSDELYGFVQENIRGRVSSISFDSNGDNIPEYISHFNYDVHGNLKTLVQNNNTNEFSGLYIKYVRIDYDYDLVSGNVKKVSYQAGLPDQFYHKYYYDADNRLTNVMTSHDNVIWDQDARYFYYKHGPLARIELGDEKVQGIDFAYTIQGWLKGVNSDIVQPANDQGKDGIKGNVYISSQADIHSNVARDAFGYSLGYYDASSGNVTGAPFVASSLKDYNPADPSKANFLSNYTNNLNVNNTSNVTPATEAPNLFNGNIKHMVTSINTNNGVVQTMTPMLTAYKYDQLNRIKQMKAYSTMSQSTPNEWNNGSNNANQFTSNYSYDANGNIISLKRRDIAGVLLDDLQYKYDLTNQANYPQAKRSNRLYSWAENAGVTTNGEDIEAPTIPFSSGSPTQSINSINNFRYDEIGNLVYDESNHITNIEWNAYGKMTKITKSGNYSDLEFLYDGNGNRIQKIEKVKLNGVLDDENNFHRTYYVHDAQGNILSVYESRFNLLSLDNNYYLQEINLYGSSRLGMYRPKLNGNSPPGNNSRILGLKEFELTNHLGNVLTVVSDRKIPVDDGVYNSDGTKVIGSIPDGLIDYYKADVKSSQDYYPFGMIMPGRQIPSSEYRYGFNGQEKVDELKGSGNHLEFKFRDYDPRLGKFFSVDPAFKNYPWNSTYAFAENRVVEGVDLEGKEYSENFLTEEAMKAIRNPSGYSIEKPELQVQSAIQLFRNRSGEVNNFIAIPISLQTAKIESSGRIDADYARFDSKENKIIVNYNASKNGIEDALSIIFHEAMHKNTEMKSIYPYKGNIPTGEFEEIDMSEFKQPNVKIPMVATPSNYSLNELRSYTGEIGLNLSGFTNISAIRMNKISTEINNYSKQAQSAEMLEKEKNYNPDGTPK